MEGTKGSEEKKAILIVDDNSVCRMTLASYLRAELNDTFKVLEAQNSSSALKILEERRGDLFLIILDQHIGEELGSELAAIIEQRYPGIDMIGISARNGVESPDGRRMGWTAKNRGSIRFYCIKGTLNRIGSEVIINFIHRKRDKISL